MTHRFALSALAILVTMTRLGAAPLPDDKKSERFAFRETKLENGLRVISLEDFSCPIVAVQVWYHVGSKDEAVDRNGFAHMFEHMMFRGTDRLGPTDHFDLIRGVGGSCNAYTSFDNTTYINVAPSNQLRLLLWLEAERMVALKIDEGGFQTERRVVEEERRMGLNRPYGSLPERVLAELFPSHPYRWSPIGNIPHLRAAAVDELQVFWDKFYVPNNAVLVVVGAVKHEEAAAAAKEYFGWIPRCPQPAKVPPIETPREGPIALKLQEKNGPVPIAAVGYYGPPAGHDDSAALEIFAQILGVGDSSRLHRRLVKEKKVAAFSMAMSFQLEHAGIFGAVAALSPFGNAKKAIAALDAEIAEVIEKGVTEKELLKAKNNLLKSRVAQTLHIESKAQALGNAALILGDTKTVNHELDDIQKVTIADVQRVAKAYCVEKRRATMVVKPTILGMIGSILGAGGKKKGEGDGGAESAPVNESGRRVEATGPKSTAKRPDGLPSAPPVATALRTIPKLPSESFRLDNGLEIVVVPDSEVPLVSIFAALPYGAATDPRDRPGTAAMACAMVTKGTKKRSAAQIADDLETYAIDVGGSADHDSSSVQVSALAGEFDRAIDNLAEVLREPTFPSDELKTFVGSALTGKRVQEKDPSYIASAEFDRVVYGAHPYARPDDGTAADMKRLTSDDLSAWWVKYARPDRMVIYVAGDVDTKHARDRIAKAFGEWKAPDGDAPNVELPEFPKPEKTKIYLVDLPGAHQSQIRVGHLTGIRRSSSEYADSTVLNQVFGGSFGARLNSTLRVEKGLTYGISGGFRWRPNGGAFGISTFTKTPKTAESVKVILGEIDRLLSEPPSSEEMGGACNFLTGSFARRRETPQAVLNDLWTIRSESLEENHFARYLEYVANSKSEGVAAVAKRHVKPSELAIVVVGEAKAVKDDLAKIAEVVVITQKDRKKRE